MSTNKKPPTPAVPGAGTDTTRNEYIPSFISKRPFWAEGTHTSDTDYLEHQRLQSAPKDTLDKAKWYDRGKKLGPAATKFRKGACENCGAMTHKTKECLSRPRKAGAKWTGRDIQADEIVEDVSLGWDAKRDRWNGYDSREYSAVVKEYEELESLKKATGNTTKDGADLDDARIAEETDMGRSQPTSTRQLRLREDTAAYLKNLDLESARYDPKTRSMDKTDLPPNVSDVDVSDGFTRPAATLDDAAAFEAAQKYAWETQENANMAGAKKLHLQANPTEGEILRKKQIQEAEAKKTASRQALLEKYGDAALPASKKPKTANVSASERYVEYDEQGQIKGAEKTVARSKYQEDVLTNNHSSVWGSWWRDFTWGYACCHSTVKNSYCTGEEGRRAWEESEGLRTGQALLGIENGEGDEKVVENKHAIRTEAVVGDEKARLRLQQDAEDVNERKDTDEVDTSVEKTKAQTKKRTLQELQSGISEEELESYKRNRLAADDPMAGMLGRDELVEMR
ncbi:mRNA splicing protein [Cladophialophora chaetospira]|uniref:Pre-mRNA-splicing factor SLU7 n=1 Tax=Cladophialophora chaetospira TaxID=386627 RepID=A0AA38XI71_9EURO|nr:mRNA splicing protein [Cladophialophora chaetospira]